MGSGEIAGARRGRLNSNTSQSALIDFAMAEAQAEWKVRFPDSPRCTTFDEELAVQAVLCIRFDGGMQDATKDTAFWCARLNKLFSEICL